VAVTEAKAEDPLPPFSRKLDRVKEHAARATSNETDRALLHAYAGCLTVAELCAASILCILDHPEARKALRYQLEKRIPGGLVDGELLHSFAEDLVELGQNDLSRRAGADTLLSIYYRFFPAAVRVLLLETWRDRGTASSMNRWLNAIADDDELFDEQLVMDHWRQTAKWRAARALARKASPDFLSAVLLELIGGDAPGAIISSAALRLPQIHAAAWDALRQERPGTFAYLAAMKDRKVSAREAYDLVRRSDEADRGLVIWAIGKMQLWNVLEKVRKEGPLFADPFAKYRLEAAEGAAQ
jgi:hypothetical protein